MAVEVKMKPSMALTMMEALTSTIIATENRVESWKRTRLELLARLDRGEDIATLGQEAADAIGARIVEAHEEDAPSAPVAGPTAPVAPAKRRGRPPKQPTLPGAVIGDDRAREPVDEAKNAAEIRAIKAALADGPLTRDELRLNAQLELGSIVRHLMAGALIEEYEGSRAPGMTPIMLVRLTSQRPAS